MLRQYELVDLVKSYDKDADEDALNRAYVFAMKNTAPNYGLPATPTIRIRWKLPVS